MHKPGSVTFIGLDMAAGPDRSVTLQVTPEIMEQLRRENEEFIASRPVDFKAADALMARSFGLTPKE